MVWLIGSGGMALDYIKVLAGLGCEFVVIGRGEESAAVCEKEANCSVIRGGVEGYLKTNPPLPTHAILAVSAEALFDTSKALLRYGVKNILAEKPGAIYGWQFEELQRLADEKEANLLVAYNRRFYSSVMAAQKIIEEDGGVSSFNFEFTEWAHKIAPLKKGPGIKERWFLGNSTHVVDLAFYLGGKPVEICMFTSGGLDWHPSASVFSGAGISEFGAPFSYQANWESAGRWSVEMLTKEHRLVFRPLEKLQIQKKGSILLENAEIDYGVDETYKPGLFRQTQQFLRGEHAAFCSIEQQYRMMGTYHRMAKYEE